MKIVKNLTISFDNAPGSDYFIRGPGRWRVHLDNLDTYENVNILEFEIVDDKHISEKEKLMIMFEELISKIKDLK